MTKARDGVDLDAILDELGHLGRYQVRTYCLILLPMMLSGLYNSQYIFTAAEVEYRCQVPECEADPPEFSAADWAVWALPPDARCRRREPVGPACHPDSFLSDTRRCDAWLYRNNNSIVAEFGLACQDWKRTLVGTVHSAGMIVALALVGFVSDTFGRRTAFILTAVSHAPMGVARAFSTHYVMFLVFEFLDAALGSGAYSSGFVLALEMIGLKRRVLAGNIIPSFFALGQVTLALAAWALPHWKVLTLVIYAPSFLFLMYFFFLEESVRWLLSKGRREEAAKIIFKAAAINKVELSAEATKHLMEEPKQGSSKALHEEPDERPRSLVQQVIRSRVIMSRLCICSYWWITLTFIYYGLSINSVSLAGNMYVNYILTSLVEIPGYALSVLTLDRFGRKSSIMTAFFICGISLISLPFVPGDMSGLTLSLALAGKLWISMAFASMYIYAAELFPTRARTSLLCLCSLAGRVGQALAPMTPLLMQYMKSLPYLVFGVLAASSALLLLLTPETLRVRLPDTVAQAENIVLAPRTTHPTDIIDD